MKHFFSSIYFLFFVNLILSQNQTIVGVVKNNLNQSGIEFVSIFIKDTFIGVTTDEKGNFALSIDEENLNKNIVFQRLGFKLDTLSIQYALKHNIFYLSPIDKNIDEVVIYPIDPFELIQKAIDRIPENYHSPSIAQSAIYRQAIVANNELLGIEEADFNMVNTFHKKPYPYNVEVQKSRGFVDLSIVKELGRVVERNLKDDTLYIEDNAEILRFFNPDYESIVDNKKGFLGEKGDKLYQYKYNGLVLKDNHVAHFISFDQKENLKKILFRGNVYIDTASLAVVEIEAELSPQGVDFQKLIPLRFRILMKIAGYNIEIRNIKFRAHYVKHRNFWVIKDGDFYLSGAVSKRNNITIDGYFLGEYYVKENFPKQQFFRRPNFFDKIVPNILTFREDSFWEGNFNLPMKPEIKELLEKRLKE